MRENANRISVSLLALTVLSTSLSAQTTAPPVSCPNPALQRLEHEIAGLSKVSGGVVGVTAIHLETGRRVAMNGSERFPMASTFKVPIAVQLLTRVDKGEVKLTNFAPLSPFAIASNCFLEKWAEQKSSTRGNYAQLADYLLPDLLFCLTFWQ